MGVPFITQLQRITDRLSLRYPGREDIKRHGIGQAPMTVLGDGLLNV